MISANFVRELKKGHYLPLTQALYCLDLKDSIVFRKDFFRALNKAKSRFRKQSLTTDSLFLVETFSIDKKKKGEFSRMLNDLIEDFSSEAEFPCGDTVAEIVLGFTTSN